MGKVSTAITKNATVTEVSTPVSMNLFVRQVIHFDWSPRISVTTFTIRGTTNQRMKRREGRGNLMTL